jgi:hypothetical protein
LIQSTWIRVSSALMASFVGIALPPSGSHLR